MRISHPSEQDFRKPKQSRDRSHAAATYQALVNLRHDGRDIQLVFKGADDSRGCWFKIRNVFSNETLDTIQVSWNDMSRERTEIALKQMALHQFLVGDE